MSLLRRTPLVRTTISFHPGGRVAVVVEPSPSRWPGREGPDRLVLPLGLAALALARSDAAIISVVRDRLHHAASAVARKRQDEGVEGLLRATCGLELAHDVEQPGDPRVVVQLVRSALGPVPTLGRARHGSLTLVAAAGATLAACLAPMDSQVRLASALAIEGLLGWYRVADPHLQPPQQAIAYALRHAAARLSEEDAFVPLELAAAIEEHRKIDPMAGGA